MHHHLSYDYKHKTGGPAQKKGKEKYVLLSSK
jgi:hypothetical protein